MFIRSKVVKGRTYYQVVEGVRVGPRVRQRVVMALGTTADPAVALENMRRELAEVRAGYRRGTIRSNRRMEQLHRRMERLTAEITTLSHILEQKLIGAPPRRCTTKIRSRAIHESGHAVDRFLAGFKVGYVTIEPDGNSGGHVAMRRGPKRIEWAWELDSIQRRERLSRDLEFLCAGTAAEAIDDPERFGEGFYFSGADGGDFRDCLELMSGAELDSGAIAHYLCEAFLIAKERLRRPETWCQVVALAERLIEERSLTGEQAKAICDAAKTQHRQQQAAASAR